MQFPNGISFPILSPANTCLILSTSGFNQELHSNCNPRRHVTRDWLKPVFLIIVEKTIIHWFILAWCVFPKLIRNSNTSLYPELGTFSFAQELQSSFLPDFLQFPKFADNQMEMMPFFLHLDLCSENSS